MDEEVFFYWEEMDCVSSLTAYHAKEIADVVPLVEAHPNAIYFYATLIPS